MHSFFKSTLFLSSCLLFTSLAHAQQGELKHVFKGMVFDEDNQPVREAHIHFKEIDQQVYTDSLGNFLIQLPTKSRLSTTVKVFGYESYNFILKTGGQDTTTRDILLRKYAYELDGAVIRKERTRKDAGNISIIDVQNKVDNLPGASGIEGLLKVILGSNNELTSQYRVRGGNFDENLVYVNDFEINRPFLVRSGQQEGLSFVNPDLVSGVNFSVGGFQAKYGDKLSSVLDVTYKKPKQFGGSALISLLGYQAHLEGISNNKKFTYLIGYRQKSNRSLLNSQSTQGVYNPSFTDVQALLNYKLSAKSDIEFIGNFARNRFTFEPQSSTTAFGGINQAYNFSVFYDGSEKDQFDNSFGGLAYTFRPNAKTKLKLLASTFVTNEQETYDIFGEYVLSQVELGLGSDNLGQNTIALGSGAMHDYARNYLKAQVSTIGHKGTYDAGRHFWSWGVDYSYVEINDRLLEWQRRDSAGFSQPHNEYAVNMYSAYQAENKLNYSRLSAFVQDNILLNESGDAVLSLGVRSNYSFLNEELLISPRAQISFKPRWDNDVIFKFSTGLYAQPPFYRELRDMEGNLNTALKAQKSFQVSGGMDYNFKGWGERPFKLMAELYYKNLWDVVPYEFDNVRIRYAANNNAEAFAYGGELRLFGDIVKDAESWISLGLMNTKQRLYDEATDTYTQYYDRPSNQLVTFGMFFSDYLPQNHNFKMYLNLMYAAGLPTAPLGKLSDDNLRRKLPDYKRVDIGFSALLLDGAKNNQRRYSVFKDMKSIWFSLEVFNLLGIQNTLSYQYIQSVNANYNYQIPNRLTGTILNAKLAVRF